MSIRGLEAVLADVKQLGELPDSVSRRTIKRRRDEQLAECSTEFGPLMQFMDVPEEDKPGEVVKVPILPPAAWLASATYQCAGWRSFFQARLQASPCSHTAPWKIVVYADEVSPGNQLKHCNARKLQVLYWSFWELGPHALSTESCWFPLMAVRSCLVQKLGGMSKLWRQAMELFFTGHDFRTGLYLRTYGTLVFADIGVLVADEAAIKQALENKGASGTVLCCHCSNVIDFKSQLQWHDRSGELVSSLSTDVRSWRLHTENSVKQLIAFLQEQRSVLNLGQFAKLEQSLGFNFRPHGLLAQPEWGPKFVERTMFDWMHVYLVHGVANVQCGLVVGVLARHGFSIKHMREFAQGFNWPARLRGAAPKTVLDKRGASEPIKCSASELLNFVQLLRAFVLLFVCSTEPAQEVKDVVECFFLLCEILDTYTTLPHRRHDANMLLQTVQQHLETFKRIHGVDHWTTKFHLSLHLPLQLKKHGCLVSCFVHERKHKCVKRVANHVLDTSKAFESSVLQDIVYRQFDVMKSPAEMPGSAVSLVNARAAPKRLANVVRQSLGALEDAVVESAADAIHAGGYTVARGDIASIQLYHAAQVEKRVGRIEFHAAVGQVTWSCVHLWDTVDGFMYRVKDNPVLIPTEWILGTCPWSQRDGAAIVLLPPT